MDIVCTAIANLLLNSVSVWMCCSFTLNSTCSTLLQFKCIYAAYMLFVIFHASLIYICFRTIKMLHCTVILFHVHSCCTKYKKIEKMFKINIDLDENPTVMFTQCFKYIKTCVIWSSTHYRISWVPQDMVCFFCWWLEHCSCHGMSVL